MPEELDWMINFLLKKDIQSILTFGVGGIEYRIAEAYQRIKELLKGECFLSDLKWQKAQRR